MNVSELIAELQKLDPEMPVAVEGAEGGADIVDRLHVVELVRGVDPELAHGDVGRYCFTSGSQVQLPPDPDSKPFRAVILPRLEVRERYRKS